MASFDVDNEANMRRAGGTMRVAMLVPAMAVVALAGCRRDAPQAAGDVVQAEASAAGVVVDSPWIRAMAPGAKAAAGFGTLRNTGAAPDRLVSAHSADAARVEIHEVREEGGMMRMRELEAGLPLPAGEAVALAPGGYHMMLVEPVRAFKEGEQVAIELRFEHAGPRQVVFPVRGLLQDGHDGHADHH